MSMLILFLAALASVTCQVQSQSFRQVTAAAMWPARSEASLEYIANRQSTFRCYNEVTGRITPLSLESYFLLAGGQARGGMVTNDVWVGRPSGIDWCFASGATSEHIQHPVYAYNSFLPSRNAATCQDSVYRQYRVGGVTDDGQVIGDVWYTVDGVTWREIAIGILDPRYSASLVADSLDRLILTGGVLADESVSNDAWRSSDQGRTWIRMSSRAERLDGRGAAILLSSGSIWNTDSMLLWLSGIDTEIRPNNGKAYFQDVWASSTSGRDWNVVTWAAAFGRRAEANAEITSSGLIVLTGGYNEASLETYNDVWVSANGGYGWQSCVIDAEWEDRRSMQTMLDAEGYLWIMGGEIGSGMQNDVWKSVISYNDTAAVSRQCAMSVPACGIGLKCWPGSPNTLISYDGLSVYCDVCPFTNGSSSSSTGSIVVDSSSGGTGLDESSSSSFTSESSSRSTGDSSTGHAPDISHSDLSSGSIASIVLGVIVFVLLLVVGVLWKQRHDSYQSTKTSNSLLYRSNELSSM